MMKAIHLLWIIPLCVALGWFVCYELQSGTSMLGWNLSEICLDKLKPLDDFTQCQDKCLFKTQALNYEMCYWSCK